MCVCVRLRGWGKMHPFKMSMASFLSRRHLNATSCAVIQEGSGMYCAGLHPWSLIRSHVPSCLSPVANVFQLFRPWDLHHVSLQPSSRAKIWRAVTFFSGPLKDSPCPKPHKHYQKCLQSTTCPPLSPHIHNFGTELSQAMCFIGFEIYVRTQRMTLLQGLNKKEIEQNCFLVP